VSWLVSVIVAFGTVPPCWSLTVPTSDAYCAPKGKAVRNRKMTTVTMDDALSMASLQAIRCKTFFEPTTDKPRKVLTIRREILLKEAGITLV
jgi:hypothetical protein